MNSLSKEQIHKSDNATSQQHARKNIELSIAFVRCEVIKEALLIL